MYKVGRNDFTGAIFSFDTLEEAEAKIAEIEEICPADARVRYMNR